MTVYIDHAEARPPIEVVHENLSTGETILYNPDYAGDAPTEWIRSDCYVSVGADQ